MADSVHDFDFLEVSLRAFEHVRSNYSYYDESIMEDMIELMEVILQCATVPINNQDDLFSSLRDLILRKKEGKTKR